jgi:hypothetical protein
VASPRFREEILVPFASTLAEAPDATHCRSTLLLASIGRLRQHGLYDRYASVMPREHLAAIQSATGAGEWLPIGVGVAHYRACDALGLPDDQVLLLGAEVVHELQRTFIGTFLKAASQGTGVGLLAGMLKFATIYTRSIRGGGGRVVRIGPKDMRLEFVGLPLSPIHYFRVAYRGFIQAGCELFAKRVVVAELAAFAGPTTLGYRVAWV